MWWTCTKWLNTFQHHINPITLRLYNLQSNLHSNNCFNMLQPSTNSFNPNRPGHIDCLKQIHSLTFSQIDESRRSRIMSIHGRQTQPWKSPTNLYESGIIWDSCGFWSISMYFLCHSITWNLELSSNHTYHLDFRLWRRQAYVIQCIDMYW